jgi:hypothetical protein
MIATLLARLDTARARLRRMRLAAGALSMLATLVVAAFAWFLCDWLFVHRILEGGAWDTGLRAVLAAGVLAAIGRVAWLTFIPEWRIHRDDEVVAGCVERRHRALGGRLISSVQLARAKTGNAMAPDLIEALIVATAAEAEAFDFNAIVDFGELKRAAWWALVPLLVVGGLSAWQPGHAQTAVRRMMLLPADYPTASRIIAVTPRPAEGALTHPQGEPLAFTVTLDEHGYLPEAAEIAIRSVDGRTASVRLKRDEQHPNIYAGSISQVLADMEFRAYAFDARSPTWTPVSIQRRPALKEVMATVTPPAYMQEAPQTSALTDMAVTVGTELTLAARFAEPVATATLELLGANGEPQQVPFVLDATHASGQLKFPVTATTALRVLLTDEHHLSNAEPVTTTITAIPDLPPQVVMTYPQRDVSATRFARWPVRFTVKDDHGLGKAVIRWQLEDAVGDPNTIELGDIGPGLGAQRETVFELNKLNPPIGARILVWIEVLDRKQPQPNRGASLKRAITILDPEQLRQELEAAQDAAVEAIGTARERQREIQQGVDQLKKKP